MSSNLTVILPALIMLALLQISRTCNEMQPCSAIVLIGLLLVGAAVAYRWSKLSIIALSALLALFAQWGIMQFIVQHDFNLHYLNESPITNQTPGVATFSIGSQKIVRAYGPFPHPNIFGGILVAGLTLTLVYTPRTWRTYIAPVLITGIVLSFSRSAYLGLVVLLLFVSRPRLSFPKIALGVICLLITPLLLFRMFDPNGVAVTERLRGYTWATAIIQEYTQGVGIGNYVPALQEYIEKNDIDLQPWEYAPVHSVPLLAIAEIGIVSLTGLLLALIYSLPGKSLYLILPSIPAIFLDHYFATNIGAFAMLCMLLAVGTQHTWIRKRVA